MAGRLGAYALFASSPGRSGSDADAIPGEENDLDATPSPALQRLNRLLAEPYGGDHALLKTSPAHPQPSSGNLASQEIKSNEIGQGRPGPTSPLLTLNSRPSPVSARVSPLANRPNGAWAAAKPRRSQRQPNLWYKGQNNARIRIEMLSSWSTCVILLASYAVLWFGLLVDSSTWLEHSSMTLSSTDCSASQMKGSSGCTEATDHGVTWIAYAHGLPPAHSGGFLRVEANFAIPKSNTEATSRDLHFSTVLRAYTAKGWENIFMSGQKAVTVVCGTGTDSNFADVDEETKASFCQPVPLLDVFFDRPGLARGASSFEVQIMFDGEMGQSLATAEGSTYKVSHQSPFFSFVLKVVRLVLLATTIGAIIRWYRDLRNPSVVHRRPEEKHFCRWTPERQTLTFMIFSLLFVQNPALVFVEWSPAPELRSGFLLTADLMQGIGQQILWLTWLILVAGLECYTHPGVLRTGLNADGYMSVPNHSRRRSLPPHHPQSRDIAHFLLKKLLFFGASVVAITGLCCLRYPQIIVKDAWVPTPGKADAVLVAYYIFLVGVFVVTLGWVCLFGRATWRTGQALRHAPYVATRFAQLAYRIILIQALLAVFSLGVSYVVEVWRIMAALRLHISHGSEIRGAQLESELHMESWASVNANPPGKLLFVSVVCYTILYIFLPPKENQLGGLTHFHTNMEKHVPEARRVLKQYSQAAQERHTWPFRSIFAPKLDPPIFCLETAYRLLQVAYETYCDPVEQATVNGLKGRAMDVENLGLRLEGFIYDQDSQTYGILVRGLNPRRLILAWRGTTSTEAMHTAQRVAHDSYVSLPIGDVEEPFSPLERSRFAAVRACCTSCLERVPIVREALPKVRTSYWRSYERVHQQTVRLVRRALQEEYAPLVTTGHSLGGALAVLAAYNIQDALPSYLHDAVSVYTFGAPSVGNAAFQFKLDKLVPHHFRVVVEGDIVPGTVGLCRALPQQCGTLILVDSESPENIIVAPVFLESLFRSDSWGIASNRRGFDPKVSHKIKTYDVCLKRCFNSDEFATITANSASLV